MRSVDMYIGDWLFILQAYTSQFISLVMFGLMMSEDRLSMQERYNTIIRGLKKLPGIKMQHGIMA